MRLNSSKESRMETNSSCISRQPATWLLALPRLSKSIRAKGRDKEAGASRGRKARSRETMDPAGKHHRHGLDGRGDRTHLYHTHRVRKRAFQRLAPSGRSRPLWDHSSCARKGKSSVKWHRGIPFRKIRVHSFSFRSGRSGCCQNREINLTRRSDARGNKIPPYLQEVHVSVNSGLLDGYGFSAKEPYFNLRRILHLLDGMGELVFVPELREESGDYVAAPQNHEMFRELKVMFA